MRKKTLERRIHDALLRNYNMDDSLKVKIQEDHVRIGWYSAGYRAGFRAAQRTARDAGEKS